MNKASTSSVVEGVIINKIEDWLTLEIETVLDILDNSELIVVNFHLQSLSDFLRCEFSYAKKYSGCYIVKKSKQESPKQLEEKICETVANWLKNLKEVKFPLEIQLFIRKDRISGKIIISNEPVSF